MRSARRVTFTTGLASIPDIIERDVLLGHIRLLNDVARLAPTGRDNDVENGLRWCDEGCLQRWECRRQR